MDDDLDPRLAAFDEVLAELQQCDADPPVDDGVAARQADLREQARRQARELETDGVLPPGHPWWLPVRAATYNLHDHTREATPQLAAQRDLIRELGADVLCLQELRCRTDDPHDPALDGLLGELCTDLGMDGRLAWARSGHHTAVLWNPDRASLVAWQDYRHWPWHHTAGVATLDVGARQPLTVASAHFSPFSADQRAHEAQLLGAVVPDPGARWMLAGLDLNAPSADAPEPYEDQDPRRRHQLHQRIVSDIWPAGSDVAPVDRRAALLLDRHGLRDLADRHGRGDLATTGHHPADPHGPRRPDALRATPALAAMAGGVRVRDTPEYRAASDHLPLSVTLTLPWRPIAAEAAATGTAGTLGS